MFNVKIW